MIWKIRWHLHVHSTGTIVVGWLQRSILAAWAAFWLRVHKLLRKLGVLFSEVSNSELQCISLLSYLFQLCGISLIFVGVGRPRHRWNLLWHSTTEVGNLVGDVSHIWWCCGWNYLFPIYRGWEILQGSCSRLSIKGYVLRGSLLQKHFLASWSRHNQRHEGLHQTQ